MSNCFKYVLGLALVVSLPATAGMPDAVSLELGDGDQTSMARVGAQWTWEREWFKGDKAQLGGYWDLTLASWRLSRYRNVQGADKRIADIGITPVFRYAGSGATGAYAEAGIGVHMLSDLYDNGTHRLATRFQFGDHVALGYRFAGGWDASVKFQHFSNGGIKHPNGGVNYLVVGLAKSLR